MSDRSPSRSAATYVFQYTEDALTAEGFYPLTQFPDRDKTYVSSALPAFFVNRLMSRKRESYPDYLHSLGIDSSQLDTPMELLARTGVPRETDTFHLVNDLAEDAEGVVTTRFLASGVRHIPGATDRLAKVEPGQALILEPEPGNPANPGALLICVRAHDPVGLRARLAAVGREGPARKVHGVQRDRRADQPRCPPASTPAMPDRGTTARHLTADDPPPTRPSATGWLAPP